MKLEVRAFSVFLALHMESAEYVFLHFCAADPENKYVALLYAPIRCLDYTWTILFGVCVRSKAYEEVEIIYIASLI